MHTELSKDSREMDVPESPYMLGAQRSNGSHCVRERDQRNSYREWCEGRKRGQGEGCLPFDLGMKRALCYRQESSVDGVRVCIEKREAREEKNPLKGLRGPPYRAGKLWSHV